jgi:hypothetical protein
MQVEGSRGDYHSGTPSIPHLKRRIVPRPGLPPIVEPRGRNIRMPEPFLGDGKDSSRKPTDLLTN